MKKTLTAFATIATLSPFAALAQSSQDSQINENGLYLGANYGYLRVEGEDDFDEDKDVWQGVVGYRFNRYLALEGSYIDFGDYGNDLAEASTDGYTAALKGTIPLTDRFSIYGKLGQLWSETDYRAGPISEQSDDESLFVGGGVSFLITQNLAINAEYTVYDSELNAEQAADDIDDVNFETDLKQASLGLEYRF